MKKKEKKKWTVKEMFREGIADALGIDPNEISDEELLESIKNAKRVD